jgi:protein involved in polysaccharide export with SLBB domain
MKRVVEKRYLLSLLYFSLLAILFLSCANNQVSIKPDMPVADAASSSDERLEQYYLQIGDVLDINFFFNPELNQTVTIRPDGKISLHFIGELLAVDLSPSQLNEALNEKYKEVLKKPGVTVNVQKFEERKIYVGGEVMLPAMIPFVRGTTALKAIFSVGGFRETASKKSVIIISKGPDNLPIAREVDLKEVISGKAPGGDVLLQPFDIVYVPKTSVADLNKFVEQYITKMIPGTLTAGFNYTIFKGSTWNR